MAAACGKMSTEQIDEMLQVGAVPISLYFGCLRERRYVEEFNTSNSAAITKDQMKQMKIALDP